MDGEPDAQQPEAAAVPRSAVRHAWRPWERWLWWGLAVLGLLQALLHVDAGRPVLAVLWGALSVAYVGLGVRWQRVVVTDDGQHLRIAGPGGAVLPWAEVREVRGDAGRWSTRTVVETRDGRAVLLPRGLDVARVRQWQHESAAGRPPQAP